MKIINCKKRFRESIFTCHENPKFLQKLREALSECGFSIIPIINKKDYDIRCAITSNGTSSIKVVYNK